MIVTPAIPQSQEYHDFADQRTFFGNYHFLFTTLSLLCYLRWTCVYLLSVILEELV